MNPSTRSRNTSPRFARQRRQEALKRATHRDAWYERIVDHVQGEQE